MVQQIRAWLIPPPRVQFAVPDAPDIRVLWAVRPNAIRLRRQGGDFPLQGWC
jgi:hypothetical protein